MLRVTRTIATRNPGLPNRTDGFRKPLPGTWTDAPDFRYEYDIRGDPVERGAGAEPQMVAEEGAEGRRELRIDALHVWEVHLLLMLLSLSL